jgi:hypothetical protein
MRTLKEPHEYDGSNIDDVARHIREFIKSQTMRAQVYEKSFNSELINKSKSSKKRRTSRYKKYWRPQSEKASNFG